MKNVYLEACNETRETQKWLVDSLNEDALKKWNETAPLL
jgi:hypothetical protein